MSERSQHNAALRRIASALRLDRKQIREIVSLGGIEISASQADGWRRGAGTYRKPDAGSNNPNELERRDKPISDDEWYAFWDGLDIWLHRTSGDG